MPEDPSPQKDLEEVRLQLSEIVRNELIQVSELQRLADKLRAVAEKTSRMARDAGGK